MNHGWKLGIETSIVFASIALAGCTAPEQAQEVGKVLAASSVRGELEKQLALAREEGIITSQDELTACMGKAPTEEENAWPVLEEIHFLPRKVTEKTWIWTSLESGRPPTVKELQGIVDELKPLLDLAEEAADRKVIWYEGTEADREKRVYHLSRAARRSAFALTARSELNRARGDSGAALADIRAVLRLSDLAFKLKDGAGLPLSDELRGGIEKRLICWAAESKPNSPWVKDLESICQTRPIPDPKATLRASLLYWISRAESQHQKRGTMLDRSRSSQTAFSRRLYKEDPREYRDIDKRRLMMVKSFRGIWQTLSTDWPSGLGKLSKSRTYPDWSNSDLTTFVRYAMANPDSSQPFHIDGDNPFLPIKSLKAIVQQSVLLEGAVRVLKSPLRSEAVSMKGLVDPIDGTPVTIKTRVFPPPTVGSPSRGNSVLSLGFEQKSGEAFTFIPMVFDRRIK